MAHFIHLKWIGYITEITDILRKGIDNNLYTCDVFLDFSKAFDTADHGILLGKLEECGIRGAPLRLFHYSYLTYRKQYVDLRGVESTRQTVLCGTRSWTALIFNLH